MSALQLAEIREGSLHKRYVCADGLIISVRHHPHCQWPFTLCLYDRAPFMHEQVARRDKDYWSVNVLKSERYNKAQKPTGMNVRVLLHIAFLMKSLAAVLARIWSRVAVYEEMRGEGRRALERLAALIASEAAKKYF